MGTYNAQNAIKESVRSIEKQTYQNWEFIICDDCSQDATKEILDKIAKEDDRIKVIYNSKNEGLAKSLNHCLEYVHGNYIARMDSDDISLPKRLEIEMKYLLSNPSVDIVGTNMIVFDENGDRGIMKYPKVVNDEAFLHGNPFAHPTILAKKKIFTDTGGYSGNIRKTEDLDLWFRVISNGFKGRNISQPLYKYHVSIKDYKRRSLKVAFEASNVYWKGYTKLNIPWYRRGHFIKPIVSALLPHKVMFWYHQRKLNIKK
nr:glycosyltransferase [Lactobacillus gallinarum]